MSKKNGSLNAKLIAIGNYGCNILKRMDYIEKQGVQRCALSINDKIFSKLNIKDKIELPFDVHIGYGEDIEKNSIEVIKQKQNDIIKLVEKTDIVFLLGNLTNEVSSFQAREVAKIIKQKNILVFFVSALPFFFEGQVKHKNAQNMKVMLEEVVDALLVVDNNKIIKQNILIKEGLSQIDKVIGEIISNIIGIVYNYGVINVDFADLKSTVENVGEIFYNNIFLSKKDLVFLTEKLFNATNLSTPTEKLSKILYVIYANKDLLMEEVNQIGKDIQKRLSDSARIIFGVVQDEKMNKDNLRVVMIGG